MATPRKDPQGVRQKSSESIRSKNHQENSNPNVTSPGLKQSNSPSVVKSAKIQKSGAKNVCTNGTMFASPRKKIRERKFVVAKKNKDVKKQELNVNCKCKEKINGKCLCVAYENLRASQEEFFKSRGNGESVDGLTKENKPMIENGQNQNGYVIDGERSELLGLKEMGNCDMIGNVVNPNGYEKNDKESEVLGFKEKGGCDCEPNEAESPKGLGSSTIKRRRDMLLEEARESVPEPGSGRVLHLVKAFEKLLTMPKESEKKDEKEEGEDDTKLAAMKWALPGLQKVKPPKAPETQESSTAFCPGELFFNAESLGLESNVSCSLDSSRGSISSRSSVGSRRSRRSSSFSSGTAGGRKWKKKKQPKVTSLRPFKLRTEQRGKTKEEEFFKKLQEMMIEEEKQRIPIAQGLPWTTDEPECLIKPPVKECTRPVDLKLHTDVRAVDRAEFDHQVNEKLTLIEQYKMERERQQKLEEEEEIRRLRKELVPKAQPMPYFDRPFIPRRSAKQPTMPKEPKFHLPQQKKIKCSLSWSDFSEY